MHKPMKIEYAPQAVDDWANVVDYHQQRGEVRFAAAFEDELERVIGELAAGAFSGPRERLKSGEVVQSWPVAPRWRVYYQERDGVLAVLRIYHERQRPIVRSGGGRRRVR